jgi:predicted alpha/beta-fold hydrolase
VRPVVLIVHGLEGSAESGVRKGDGDQGPRGWVRVFMRYNVRNCGGTSGLSPHLYHSGLTSDLQHGGAGADR